MTDTPLPCLCSDKDFVAVHITLYITSPTAPNNHNIDWLSHAVPHIGKLDLEILHSFLCSNINHSKLIARVQIDQNMKGKHVIVVPLQYFMCTQKYLKSPNPLQSWIKVIHAHIVCIFTTFWDFVQSSFWLLTARK